MMWPYISTGVTFSNKIPKRDICCVLAFLSRLSRSTVITVICHWYEIYKTVIVIANFHLLLCLYADWELFRRNLPVPASEKCPSRVSVGLASHRTLEIAFCPLETEQFTLLVPLPLWEIVLISHLSWVSLRLSSTCINITVLHYTST